MRPGKLDENTLTQWLGSHAGWEKVGAGAQDAIARTFKFGDFSAALGFVVRVGLVAEKRDHHPDVELGWGRARVVWTTHDQKGVTSLDVELAEATDALA
ncbi:MAG TPA: 4a-hydroxytetrahydrobiopterin dehydratase [Polyangiaceae bacterium]|jgi:4a-hydroxytetrahydrobiopterin dehydratase